MGTNDLLTLSRGTLTIDLYSWINGSFAEGHEALKGIEGFGLPPQANRWFEGAGDGATYRGSRVLPRVLMIPLSSQSTSRTGLDNLLSELAQLLTPRGSTQTKLRFKDDMGAVWYLNVVREEGGNYVRAPGQFKKGRFFTTTLGLKAGDPYWTRETSDSFTVRQDASGRGMLPYLAKLELSSGKVFGEIIPNNIGDAPAWPVWTIGGPLTAFTLTGPNGEVLQWSGSMITSTERRIVDTKNGTIVNENGVNKYNELGVAPNFWAFPSEEAGIQVDTVGASADSFVTAQWQPRKWSMI